MTRTRTILAGMMGGLLAFAGLLGVLGLTLLSQAAAAPPAQTSPGGSPAAPAARNPAQDQQHYADLLVQNLATKLGVSQAQLNTAFTAAANDTIAQAQRDGALTADQATQAQAQVGKGLSSLLVSGFSGAQGNKEARAVDDGGRMEAALSAVQNAVAQLFGMTYPQLADAIKAGQTLDTLEQAHHVTPQQVHDAALAAARTTLNAGVQTGKWTQAQADETYQAFSQDVDGILPKLLGGGAARVRVGGALDDNPKSAMLAALTSAVAPLFHMSAADLTAALQAGQSLHALALAHNVTDQQVKDALLPAIRANLDAGVRQGHWTQADADNFYTSFSNTFAAFLNQTPRGNDPRDARLDTANNAAVTAVALRLGVSEDDLRAAIKGGPAALHALGQAHNVSDQQLKDTAFAAARTILDAGVKDSKWTQAQADETYQAFVKQLNETLPTGGTP